MKIITSNHFPTNNIHEKISRLWLAKWNTVFRGRPFNSWGGGDFEKYFPASACRKKKIACSTNVIESLREKKGKKYPAHQIARKKNYWWPEITPPPQMVGPLGNTVQKKVTNVTFWLGNKQRNSQRANQIKIWIRSGPVSSKNRNGLRF